jgi:hypothetical protein
VTGRRPNALPDDAPDTAQGTTRALAKASRLARGRVRPPAWSGTPPEPRRPPAGHLLRGAALAALAAALGVYYGIDAHLWDASLWWDIAWLAFALIPGVFGLVGLALPLWRRGPIWLAIGFAALAAIFEVASADIAANFAKLAAVTFFAWWFLTFFEALGWVVTVACIIPFVDAYSVWRGPTRHIVENEHGIFTALSIAFPVPGGDGAANLGLPDVLFFSLFLAASVRFGLRVLPTWICMAASVGATMALAVAFDVGGLPALPLISVGFLLPNADLIWRRLRERREPS